MAVSEDLGFVHRFVAGPGRTTLLLLHGTGGDENDLLPLGRELAPQASLLSPRGQVLEGGMPRFFRRLAMGVFDEDDLIARAHDLAAFIHAAAEAYALETDDIVAVGYSNGANIAAALLLLHPGLLRSGALLHAMLPLRPPALPDLTGVRALLTAGRADPMVPFEQTEELAALLRDAGAEVSYSLYGGGHELTRAELESVRAWLQDL